MRVEPCAHRGAPCLVDVHEGNTTKARLTRRAIGLDWVRCRKSGRAPRGPGCARGVRNRPGGWQTRGRFAQRNGRCNNALPPAAEAWSSTSNARSTRRRVARPRESSIWRKAATKSLAEQRLHVRLSQAADGPCGSGEESSALVVVGVVCVDPIAKEVTYTERDGREAINGIFGGH